MGGPSGGCPPPPPARAPAWLAAYALVGEPRSDEPLAVEEVPAVDDQRRLHQALHVVLPVELRELGPFGDEHRTVRPLERLVRRRADLHAGSEHLGRAPAGDRIVGPHVRALALKPPGQHKAGGLPDVVGVRLEGDSEQRYVPSDERAEVLLELADGAPLLELVHLDDRGEELEVVAAVAG